MLQRRSQIFISCCNIPTVPPERTKWWGAACLIYMLFVAFPVMLTPLHFPISLLYPDADILLWLNAHCFLNSVFKFLFWKIPSSFSPIPLCLLKRYVDIWYEEPLYLSPHFLMASHFLPALYQFYFFPCSQPPPLLPLRLGLFQSTSYIWNFGRGGKTAINLFHS